MTHNELKSGAQDHCHQQLPHPEHHHKDLPFGVITDHRQRDLTKSHRYGPRQNALVNKFNLTGKQIFRSISIFHIHSDILSILGNSTSYAQGSLLQNSFVVLMAPLKISNMLLQKFPEPMQYHCFVRECSPGLVPDSLTFLFHYYPEQPFITGPYNTLFYKSLNYRCINL